MNEGTTFDLGALPDQPNPSAFGSITPPMTDVLTTTPTDRFVEPRSNDIHSSISAGGIPFDPSDMQAGQSAGGPVNTADLSPGLVPLQNSGLREPSADASASVPQPPAGEEAGDRVSHPQNLPPGSEGNASSGAVIRAPHGSSDYDRLIENATSDEELIAGAFGKTLVDALKRLYSPDTTSPKALAAAENAMAIYQATGISPVLTLDNPDAVNEALFGTGHAREKFLMNLIGMFGLGAASEGWSAAAALPGLTRYAKAAEAAGEAWKLRDVEGCLLPATESIYKGWTLPLGFAAITAEESANALIRSYLEGKPFSETRPYGLDDILPPRESEGAQTVVDLLDMFAKYKAMSAGFEGLRIFWDAIAYDKISRLVPSRKLYIPAEAIRNHFGAGTGGSEGDYYEVLQNLRERGILSNARVRGAVKDGLDVELPLSRVVDLMDTPWFAKIKNFLRISPDKEVREVLAGKPEGRTQGEPESREIQAEAAAKPPEEAAAKPSDDNPQPAPESAVPPLSDFAIDATLPDDQAQSLIVRKWIERLSLPRGSIRSGEQFGAGTEGSAVGVPGSKYVKLTETPEFKDWFGDSKVVFKDGETDFIQNPEGVSGVPRMVYHGTDTIHSFERLSPDNRGVILFTTQEEPLDYTGTGPQIPPAYLKMENPLETKSTLPTAVNAAIEQAKAGGNDGVIFDSGHGNHTYAVFSPDQVKSPFHRGIFNTGDAYTLKDVDRSYPEGPEEIGDHCTTIAKGFHEIEKKPVEIIGLPVESYKDLAVIAQAWRNPKYEELRYVYIRDGSIVDHEGVTCRLPMMSHAFLGDRPEGVNHIRERLAALGADSLYFVHNHPSGGLKASRQDLSLTVLTAGDVPEMKGHIIINSGKYVFIDPEGGVGLYSLPNLPDKWIDPILTPSVSHEMLGKEFTPPWDIAVWAKALTVDRNKPLIVYMNRKRIVRGIQEINPGGKMDWIQLADIMPKKLLDFGSSHAVLILPERSAGYALEVGQSLVGKGVFFDVVYTNENGTHSVLEIGARVPDKVFGGRPIGDFPVQPIR
jgi:hypothetical protein